MAQTISELTMAEISWVEGQIRAAIEFIGVFSPSDSGKPLTLAALDVAYKGWLASSPQPSAINGVINAVGVAFGDCLVRGGPFRWVIVSDDEGTELAVLALPGNGDFLVFPTNFVAKRWERSECDFLERSFADIIASVRSIGSQ